MEVEHAFLLEGLIMAAPDSASKICQLAVDRIRSGMVASIESPSTDPEIVCNRWYDHTRELLLRSYVWNFAKEYVLLSRDTNKTPAFKYSHAYALPNDWIRLLVLGDDDDNPLITKYDISGRHIFCTMSSDTATLPMTYIKNVEVVGFFDALFADLLTIELALRMCMYFTVKPSLKIDLRQDKLEIELKAAAVDGQERPPIKRYSSKLVNSRRQGQMIGSKSDSGYYTELP